MEIRHMLVAAIDVTDVARARMIARSVLGQVDAMKIGWVLYL